MKSNNTVTINGDIIEIQVVGDQTHDSVMAMGEQTRLALEALKTQNKPGLILDDLTKLGQTDTPARQAVKDLAKSLPFQKVAMVSQPSILMRYGTRLLLQAIGMGSRIKYFESREAAIRWLRKRP